MNRILLILLLPLSAIAQTTYPVLSTTTARTIVGGVTNLPHLNSNNVFTGTGRWTGAVTLTNSGNVFAGDGSGLTGVGGGGISTLDGSGTNLLLRSSGTTNSPLRIIGGSVTNSNPVDISFTYNASGTTFDGLRLNITNTAAASGSRGFDYRVGGASWVKFRSDAKQIVLDDAYTIDYASFYISLSGTILTSGTVSGNQLIAAYYDIGNSGDTYLRRSSAGVAAITSASSSTYQDLITRSTYATNLYATNLVLNGGATVTGILSATASLNFDLTALTVEDKTITVTGAAVGDIVTLGVPNGSVTTSVQYTAWVSAADTVTVRARTSATGEDPASGTFRATVIKH
jgi:hypothetical protein